MLDSANPGWRAKVNLEELDVASSERCVLGQVFGGDLGFSFGGALQFLFGSLADTEAEAVAARHGFEASAREHGRDRYVPLTEAWRAYLSEEK